MITKSVTASVIYKTLSEGSESWKTLSTDPSIMFVFVSPAQLAVV